VKRNAIDSLFKWNREADIKPALLTGMKGVGKTYLAYDFAKAFFKQILYLNFEHDPRVSEIFASSNPFSVSKNLLNYFKIDEKSDESVLAEDRILILDEIGYCPNAFNILSTLQYTGEFTRIIAITSGPVNKNELNLYYHIPVYPLLFNEFLVAIASDWYIETIITHFETNKKIPDIVHKELLALFNLYLQIGGMPAIINEYVSLGSLLNVPEQHKLLAGSGLYYLNSNYPDSDALKMQQVLGSLPNQLSKSNKKFQYKQIRKGTTHAMYKDAIKSLSELNYVIPSYKIPTEELNNINSLIEENALSIDDYTSFKLYLPDVGMLYSQLNCHTSPVDSPSDKEITRALLENFTAQTIKANGYPILFWESDSMAKVDFILPKEGSNIPVEIFCDNNTRSKSISVLKQKMEFPYSIKISSRNFEYSSNIKYVPYYAVFCL